MKSFFLLNLRSGVLLIHGQERVQTSSKQLILIWDSISSYKVHYQIKINGFNMHIVDEYMTIRYCAAMKRNYFKIYLSVPLLDKSVTNNICFATRAMLCPLRTQCRTEFKNKEVSALIRNCHE